MTTSQTNAALPALSVPKAAQVIADDLRTEIIVGGLLPDSHLPSEPELMARYQFSRASVREALRLLESDGLIYIKRGPRGGVRVSHPDDSHVSRSFSLLFATRGTPLRDLVRFRQMLEPEAASQAATYATAAQHERLMDATEPSAHGEGRPSELGFHSVLLDCTPNEMLRVTLTAVQRLSEWHIPMERLGAEEIAGTQKAHRRIALAIVRGDGEAAAKGMLHHLQSFERVLHDLGRLDQPIVPREQWGNRSVRA
jgi:GntR family transcriptional repressor for pyruvate dehydrogenase complex